MRTGNPNFLYGPPDGPVSFGNPSETATGDGINVLLPSGVTSVSFDFTNLYASGDLGQLYTVGLEVLFADGTTYTDDTLTDTQAENLSPVFVGFTSTTPITSFEVMGGGYPAIEDFSFGQTTSDTPSAPEPSYMAAVAFFMLVVVRLKRKWII